jgi:hypothetical protein
VTGHSEPEAVTYRFGALLAGRARRTVSQNARLRQGCGCHQTPARQRTRGLADSRGATCRERDRSTSVPASRSAAESRHRTTEPGPSIVATGTAARNPGVGFSDAILVRSRSCITPEVDRLPGRFQPRLSSARCTVPMCLIEASGTGLGSVGVACSAGKRTRSVPRSVVSSSSEANGGSSLPGTTALRTAAGRASWPWCDRRRHGTGSVSFSSLSRGSRCVRAVSARPGRVVPRVLRQRRRPPDPDRAGHLGRRARLRSPRAMSPRSTAGNEAQRSPCATRRRHGALRLLYAAPSSSAPAAPDRIWTVQATGFSL